MSSKSVLIQPEEGGHISTKYIFPIITTTNMALEIIKLPVIALSLLQHIIEHLQQSCYTWSELVFGKLLYLGKLHASGFQQVAILG